MSILKNIELFIDCLKKRQDINYTDDVVFVLKEPRDVVMKNVELIDPRENRFNGISVDVQLIPGSNYSLVEYDLSTGFAYNGLLGHIPMLDIKSIMVGDVKLVYMETVNYDIMYTSLLLQVETFISTIRESGLFPVNLSKKKESNIKDYLKKQLLSGKDLMWVE